MRSLPEALQVKVLLITTPELGLMDTLPMVGAVFWTVAEAEVESLPPYPSETETVQVTVSPTEAMEGLSVKEAELPTVLPPMVQA